MPVCLYDYITCLYACVPECLCACTSVSQLPAAPKVLFIANDWQTGLLPVYMQHKYRKHGVYKQARSMMATSTGKRIS